MIVQLTPGETKLIRKIARIQLASLKTIIDKEVDEDLTMFCIENEIEEEELMEDVLNTMQIFEEIHQDPREFFYLPDEDMSISKHVLFNFFKKKKYRNSKRRLVRKIAILESPYFNNLN